MTRSELSKQNLVPVAPIKTINIFRECCRFHKRKLQFPLGSYLLPTEMTCGYLPHCPTTVECNPGLLLNLKRRYINFTAHSLGLT